jgi:quinol monooxygenase YgiN
MGKIVVLAKLKATPGKRDDLVAVLSAQVGLVTDETGTEIYALHTSMDDDVTVWFYERYVDEEAFVFHGKTEAMKALGPKLAGLVDGRPEILKLAPIVAKGI